ncbi:hypothetical protein LXA43DRAFT_1063038 [Ganoderma leucocontextum]|nr:hypothetical protein LXA43DRAFT_1063038 [Ganoderma leucocontextum]
MTVVADRPLVHALAEAGFPSKAFLRLRMIFPTSITQSVGSGQGIRRIVASSSPWGSAKAQWDSVLREKLISFAICAHQRFRDRPCSFRAADLLISHFSVALPWSTGASLAQKWFEAASTNARRARESIASYDPATCHLVSRLETSIQRPTFTGSPQVLTSEAEVEAGAHFHVHRKDRKNGCGAASEAGSQNYSDAVLGMR